MKHNSHTYTASPCHHVDPHCAGGTGWVLQARANLCFVGVLGILLLENIYWKKEETECVYVYLHACKYKTFFKYYIDKNKRIFFPQTQAELTLLNTHFKITATKALASTSKSLWRLNRKPSWTFCTIQLKNNTKSQRFHDLHNLKLKETQSSCAESTQGS